MIIFSIDSSGKSAGVSILKDGEFLYEKTVCEGYTHSEMLLPLVAEAFSATALIPQDVSVYAVCAGPGSFTGLRIGLATVKGLALPHNTPVAAVSTLRALAEGCKRDGTLFAALDARRDEVYFAAFSKQNGQLVRLTEDDAAPAASLDEWISACPKPIVFLGDGSPLFCQRWKNDPDVFFEDTLHIAYGAAKAGLQAAQNGELISAVNLQPSYHRLSQAERERTANNIKENKI